MEESEAIGREIGLKLGGGVDEIVVSNIQNWITKYEKSNILLWEHQYPLFYTTQQQQKQTHVKFWDLHFVFRKPIPFQIYNLSLYPLLFILIHLLLLNYSNTLWTTQDLKCES